MSRLKDTDYLFISTRLRSLENRLLSRERMERMLEARTHEEAAKVLSECGYEGLEQLTPEALEHALAAARRDMFTELASMAPDSRLVDIFRIKFDYHNAKALIKCAAANQNAARLLTDAGRIPAERFLALYQRGELSELSDPLRTAMEEAADTLSATGDPQRCDFILDRAYYGELIQLADASGSAFMQGYVRLMIDTANLKSAVRIMRMNKNLEFLNSVILDGGNVSRSAVASAVMAGGGLDAAFSGFLQDAAALGNATARGGRQTAFEKACDDALNAYLKTSRMTPFGESVLISYIAAKESEITAARIILSGRLAGLPTESIRERLRDTYV